MMILINNLTKSYGERELFNNYNLKIEQGEFIVFSGRSGCGKTTLLNMIGAIEPVDGGTIEVDHIDITKKKNKLNYFRHKIGFLFQNFGLIDNKTVRQNLNIIRKDCKTELSIMQALDAVDLGNKIDQKVYTLSGGEQQRVALARLMLKRCEIVLADEPTGSLDSTNAQSVMDILHTLNKEGKTIILVTHDENIKKQGSRVIDL
ncbi:ATP-binding cassette domain-containing protein [Paenibacillus hunanensis]|uniref:ATP-binding cassette domain-containing protein n=1 Tax=Paenibacillus hunanensis TaxID=539262 RepID=UPI002A6A9531|nr:ATP-binding cassette domain-containing protein [Paenibacillus hunanensis]WPP41127.1 ATP-binding cassette domain-containing protein [Paenibacillus hunanensis]